MFLAKTPRTAKGPGDGPVVYVMEGLKEALETVAQRNAETYAERPGKLTPADEAIVSALFSSAPYRVLLSVYVNLLAQLPPAQHQRIISDSVASGFLMGVRARAEVEDRELNAILEQQYGSDS